MIRQIVTFEEAGWYRATVSDGAKLYSCGRHLTRQAAELACKRWERTLAGHETTKQVAPKWQKTKL